MSRSISRCALLLGAMVLWLAAPGAVAAQGAASGAPAAQSALAVQARPVAAPRRVKSAKKRRIPKGYGFLPGYRPPPPLWVRERIAAMSEPRYLDYWGSWRYGWGRPGFYQGRWNGGSFGPCWTQTPIGPIWNCGR